jgi:hypothetical protein
MQGTARAVERSQEGDRNVLRFVLEREQGAPVAVEMRADEIRGLVRAGDRVEVPADVLPGDSGLSPTRVENLSTGFSVMAWRQPWWRRLGGATAAALAAGVCSALGTLLVTSLFGGSEGGNFVTDPGPTPQEVFAWMIAVTFAALLLMTGIAHRKEPQSGRRWAVTIGGLLGAIIAALVLRA